MGGTEEVTDEKDRTDEVLHAIGSAKIEILRSVQVQNQETRAHIGNEVATVRNDGAITKNFMGRLLTAVKKLLNKMGIGTDDI